LEVGGERQNAYHWTLHEDLVGGGIAGREAVGAARDGQMASMDELLVEQFPGR
jgi:hypothetical protein